MDGLEDVNWYNFEPTRFILQAHVNSSYEGQYPTYFVNSTQPEADYAKQVIECENVFTGMRCVYIFTIPSFITSVKAIASILHEHFGENFMWRDKPNNNWNVSDFIGIEKAQAFCIVYP